MNRGLRSIVQRFLLLAIGAGLGALVAEIAVRWLQPQAVWIQTPGLYELDPAGGVKLRPGYRGDSINRVEYATRVNVNSDGLRGPELEVKRKGVLRILSIGDSLTYGVGVEDDEVFALRVADHLVRAGIAAEGLNGGVPGMGTPQEVDWLERHGLPLEPDVVILGVYAGNDLRDATVEWGGRGVEAGQLVNEGEAIGLGRWIYYHSHLFVLLKRAVPGPVQRGIRRLLGRGEPHSMRMARASFAVYSRQPTPLVESGVINTRKALARLRQLSVENDFELVAILIPDIIQVIDERWSSALRQLDLDPDGYEVTAPTRILSHLLAEQGIPTIDLTRPLKQAMEEGAEMYFPYDRHWTPAAHDLAARRLADLVLSRRLS